MPRKPRARSSAADMKRTARHSAQDTVDEVRSRVITRTAEALEEVARKLVAMAGQRGNRQSRRGGKPVPTRRGQASVPNTRRQQPVIDRAIEVIGDKAEALRWLGTPLRALDYTTPISHLADRRGEAEVLAVLDKLEHGVL